MVQHLLLMTIAPALILLGAPVQVPMFARFAAVRRGDPFWAHCFGGSRCSCWDICFPHPAICWIVGAAALVGWHIPGCAFTLGLQSEGWHVVEHTCFLWCRIFVLVARCSTSPGRVFRHGRDGRCFSLYFWQRFRATFFPGSWCSLSGWSIRCISRQRTVSACLFWRINSAPWCSAYVDLRNDLLSGACGECDHADVGRPKSTRE